jgi:MFS family permease
VQLEMPPGRVGTTDPAAIAVLCAYSWFLYGLSPTIPLIREEFGVTSSIAGLHSVLLAVGVVTGGLIGVAVARRWARAGAARLGMAGVIAGMALFVLGSLLPAAQSAVTLPAVMLAGLGGSLCLNTTSAAINDRFGTRGPTVLTRANAAAAAVGLVSPLAVGATTSLGWTWRAALVLTLPLAIVAMLLIARSSRLPAYAARPTSGSRFTIRGTPVACGLAALATVMSVAIEFSTVTWSPDLLRSQVGISAGAATASVAVVVGGTATGRLIVGALAHRFPPLPLYLAGVGMAVAGWVVVWTAGGFGVALVGLLMSGLGIAGQYPLGMSMVMAFSQGHVDRAVAIAGVGIGIALGAGPFLLGALADGLGVRWAFVVVPVFCLLAAGAAVAAVRRSVRGVPNPAR